MKKVMFIMAAALLMMTQCKKENETPTDPAEGTVKMTVTAGPGRTDINTTDGSITWSAGDKLYVSDGTNWLGSLTLVGNGGSAQGTFTGNIAGIGEGGTTCHFFYLGHDNGMAELTGTDAANISLASQDGTLAGAMKFHAGYGTTDVTVESGEYQGYVKMDTKIAIAHINFTTDGTSAYTGSLTMGGTGIFNTLSVSPDGSTFTGSGDEGITIGNGGGTTGERYVTLIPTTGTDRVDVSFTGDATGSMTFLAGIRENKFYGMKDAIAVTLEAASAPKFSVGENTTVEFAPGNLYWDGSTFRFEANQWDYRHYKGKTNDVAVIGGESMTTPAGTVGSFYWSKTASVAYAEDYSDDGASTYDVFFTEASGFQVNGYEANTWRTLTNDEWKYLLNSRDNASSLREWVTLTDVSVSGLVLLPDGSSVTPSSVTTKALVASSGAVFLPAAGRRYVTGVGNVGSLGYYWSSTSSEGGEVGAYYVGFGSGNVRTYDGYRDDGNAVRLVR